MTVLRTGDIMEQPEEIEAFRRWVNRTGIDLDSSTEQAIHDSLYSNEAAADAFEYADKRGVDKYAFVVWRLGRDHYIEGWTYSQSDGWHPAEPSGDQPSGDSDTDREESSSTTLQHERTQGRTVDEQRIIDSVGETRGAEWAERHAELILAQARLVGVLDNTGTDGG